MLPFPRFLTRSIAGAVLGGAMTPASLADFSHWICDDGIYSESSCWDDGIPSDPGEAGAIDYDNLEMPYFVTMDVDATFGTLNLAVPEVRMLINGREINPAFSFNVVPGAEVEMTSSSFIGGTGVYTNGGLLTVKRTNLIDLAGFEQNNLLRIVATGVGGNAELTVNPSFTNHGVMEFQGGCCAGNNAILIVPGAEVLTNTGGINLLAGPGNLVIDANLDNQGTVNLGKTSFFNKIGGQYGNSGDFNFGESVVLNVDNGSSFTQTGGQITMPPSSYMDVDTGGSFLFDAGTLDGQVRLTNAALRLAVPSMGGAFEFRGAGSLTGDIGSDQSVSLFATGSGLNAVVTTTGDLTNAGAMQTTAGCCNGSNTTVIVPDGSLFTNTGSLDLSAAFGLQTITADFDNQGIVTVARATAFDKADGLYANAGSFSVNSPGSVTLTNNAVFSQDGGTLDLQNATNVSVSAGGAFLFNGGDITGTGEVVLTNADLIIDPNATGPGQFRLFGSDNTLSGPVAPAQTVILQATGTGQNAAVTSVGDLNNAGLLQTAAGCCNGSNTTIIVPDGNLLTNTGVLDLNSAAGVQTITADVDNQGTISIARTTVFDKPDGLYANQGAISVASPGSINLSNNASFSQDGGTLELQDGSNLFVSTGGAFFFDGGDITGTGEVVLTNADLIIGPGATGAGLFRFIDSGNTLTGDVAPDQTLTLQATGTGQNAVVTTTAGLTNAGSIRMDGGCCSGTDDTLIVPDGGVLTNTGGLYLEGNFGVRRLTADLDNRGLLLVDRPSFLNKPDGVYQNRGTLTIQPGDSLTATGSSLVNSGPGVISGDGTLNVSGVSFLNEAAVAPGGAVGTLTVTGTYNQASSGELRIEIQGVAPGTEHDRLVVNGAGVVNLDGDLVVTLPTAFRPQASDSFTIVTGSTINGTFANAPADENGVGEVKLKRGRFRVTYNANSVVLSNFTERPLLTPTKVTGAVPAAEQGVIIP